MQLLVNNSLSTARALTPHDGFSVWLGSTCDVLCDLSRRLDGDMQKALILLVLARAQGRPGGGPVRAAHVAAATGIPRETVRRKLAAMAGDGLVERDNRRRWLMTASTTLTGPGLTRQG